MIFELLGKPTEEDLRYLQTQPDIKYRSQASSAQKKDFSNLFVGVTPEAIDLLKQLLTFDPEKRITVEAALQHPYFEDLHCDDDEPSCEVLSAYDFDFERFELSKDQYRDLILKEVDLYHDDAVKRAYVEDKANFPDGWLKRKYGDSLR